MESKPRTKSVAYQRHYADDCDKLSNYSTSSEEFFGRGKKELTKFIKKRWLNLVWSNDMSRLRLILKFGITRFII